MDLYKKFTYDECFEELLQFYEEIEGKQVDYDLEIGLEYDQYMEKGMQQEEEMGSSLIEDVPQEEELKEVEPKEDKAEIPEKSALVEDSSEEDGSIVMPSKPFKPKQIKTLFT